MKTAITTTYTFNPAAGTLNLFGISGFNVDLLYEVIDLTADQTIYDVGVQELGYSALSGTTLTLKANMTGLAAGDALQIIYDQAVSSGGAGGSVAQPGSTGVDYSANKPSLPGVGNNFGAAGPFGNYVLSATIPAGSRSSWYINNFSGGAVVYVRDDGTASAGAAPNNASVFILAAGQGVPSQGGSDSDPTFTGRIQIYTPAALSGGAYVTAGTIGQTAAADADYSVNKPSLPNVGANFGATGPFANYVLAASVPATATRAAWYINNFSGGPLVYVLDDGTAGSGSPPNNASIFMLAAGQGVPSQGGSDGNTQFKGRVQVYTPTALSGNAFVTAGQE